MSEYVEITDLSQYAQEGDVFVPGKLTPNKVADHNTTLLGDLEDKPFAKTGFVYYGPAWMGVIRLSRILSHIKLRSRTRAKIKVYRVYVPRILPGNAHYAEALPLP